MSKFIIFGAGKIARGFLGHLLFLSGHDTVFVEKSAELVKQLNERGRYFVHVMGAPDRDTWVTPVRVLALDDISGVIAEMESADGIFTAVGGKNLPELAEILAAAIPHAPRPLNIITCENWKRPAEKLKNMVLGANSDITAGFAEAVVLRSGIEPDEKTAQIDPLAVNVQNYWRLPVDADALVPGLPAVMGLEPMSNFQGFLERKFYTYNASNGTASYVGALLGYKVLSEAAHDERVIALLQKVYAETGQALSLRYDIPLEEQMAFAGNSFAKLSDPVIVDTTERNARDPLRKLGPDDRLVGSAKLAQQYGVVPDGLATAIAAAIHYTNPGDPSAERLTTLRKERGTAYILRTVCALQEDDALYTLILNKETELEAMQWIQ